VDGGDRLVKLKSDLFMCQGGIALQQSQDLYICQDRVLPYSPIENIRPEKDEQ
jgi:hypothetical protein